MVAPKPTDQVLLDIGPAAWFRPEAQDPPANQVVVKAGIVYSGGHRIFDRVSAGDQLTAGFSTVLAGQRRYDLVYLDAAGVPQILQGTSLSAATAAFEGAPGWDQGGTAGPAVPDQATPVAWVLIDETASVIVDPTDIFQITAQVKLSRDFDGYLIDKGLFGAAPTGNSDDVSALFAGDTPGGNDTTLGTITAPPLNLVHIVDQDGNDLIRTVGSHKVYGRLTEAGGTWTLTYFCDVAGVETAVDVSTEITTSPTDLRLIGVPVVFSRNDPNRPLFASSVARLSDLAAGDIPTATTVQQGKALAATSSPAIPLIGSINVIQNAGAPVAGGPFHLLNFSGGVTPGAAGEADINLAAGAPGPTGPSGNDGGPGPTGPTGPIGVGQSAQSTTGSGGSSLTANIASGTVRFGYCSIATDLFTLGNFIGTSANGQQVMICSAGGGACGRVGNVHESAFAASIFRCTTFAGVTASVTRVVGAQTFSQTAGIGVIGG